MVNYLIQSCEGLEVSSPVNEHINQPLKACCQLFIPSSQCICGLLADSTRILVSHQLQVRQLK